MPLITADLPATPHGMGPSLEASVSHEMEKTEWWAGQSSADQSQPPISLLYGNLQGNLGKWLNNSGHHQSFLRKFSQLQPSSLNSKTGNYDEKSGNIFDEQRRTLQLPWRYFSEPICNCSPTVHLLNSVCPNSPNCAGKLSCKKRVRTARLSVIR